MPRYRKKPVVIEANLYRGPEDQEAIYNWIFYAEPPGDCNYSSPDHTTAAYPNPDSLYITTLEGTMEAQPGDWIIRGVKGEFYPCKPDIFEATYEPAEDSVLPIGHAASSSPEQSVGALD
jgi:hypothetical protein